MADNNINEAAANVSTGINLEFGTTPEAPDISALKAADTGDAIIAKPEENVLSEAEKKQVEEFVGKIDLSDTNAILEYGGGVQKKMAEFSDSALQSVRTKDLGEASAVKNSDSKLLFKLLHRACDGGLRHIKQLRRLVHGTRFRNCYYVMQLCKRHTRLRSGPMP